MVMVALVASLPPVMASLAFWVVVASDPGHVSGLAWAFAGALLVISGIVAHIIWHENRDCDDAL